MLSMTGVIVEKKEMITATVTAMISRFVAHDRWTMIHGS
jgi:putative flippase GtrA